MISEPRGKWKPWSEDLVRELSFDERILYPESAGVFFDSSGRLSLDKQGHYVYSTTPVIQPNLLGLTSGDLVDDTFTAYITAARAANASDQSHSQATTYITSTDENNPHSLMTFNYTSKGNPLLLYIGYASNISLTTPRDRFFCKLRENNTPQDIWTYDHTVNGLIAGWHYLINMIHFATFPAGDLEFEIVAWKDQNLATSTVNDVILIVQELRT